LESSGAEFLRLLSKKNIKRPPAVEIDREYKIPIRGRLLRSRKPQRHVATASIPSDGDTSAEPRKFYVEDILVEARKKDGRAMYFCSWSGYGPTDASWVSAPALNQSLREWWTVEREIRYPMFRDCDFVSYERCYELLKPDVKDELLARSAGIEEGLMTDHPDPPLRVVDSKGRVKVIIFSRSSSDPDSFDESELVYRGEPAYYVSTSNI